MTEDMRVDSGEAAELATATAPSDVVENGSDSTQAAHSGAPAASDAADFEVAAELGEQAPAESAPVDPAPAEASVDQTPIDAAPADAAPADAVPTDADAAPADADAVPAAATPADASTDAPAGETPADAPSTADSADESTAETSAPATTTDDPAATETTAAETPAAETTAAAEAPSVETPSVETPAVEAPAVEAPAPEIPAAAPRPNPGRGPGGRPGRPSGGRPAVVPGGRGGVPRATGSPAAVESTAEPTDPHKWGRIDDAGVVYVYASLGERVVGNWQAGDVEAGLAHFARRFDDFATEIALLEKRLATGSGDPKATKAHAIELRESVDTLAGIGDLDSAAARLEIVIGAADAAIAGASTARAAARAAAVAAKEALCIEAETLAESEQWKATGDRLKEIVEEWRTIKGIDRKTDDALWKRFAKARDAFTRHRGTHFADLDKQRGAAKEAKEVLIARAEALADSTEWGRTAGEYRTLMEEWKASGRAPRDVEDALWDRFRAAQEKFFSHRNQTFSERDQEFETNAAIKEKLLAEAELINPAGGLDSAKAALRSIQERWEAAGKVPRERIKEFDSRLRAVEDRIKTAEDSHWRRTDPETSARIEQFRSRAATYRTQADKARAAGNERKAKEAESQAAQWEEWLAAAEGVVER